MSALDLVLRNLGAWSAQVAVLGLAAAALSRVLPVERPAARLALGQGLLLLVLGLPLVQPWRAAAVEVSFLFAESPSLASGAPSSVSASGLRPWAPASGAAAVAALLFLGAGVQLLRLAHGLLRLRALRRASRPLLAPPWLRALRDEVAPRAALVRSDASSVPATFGLRRPVVLLPPVFEGLARDRQRAVALHELLHARRGDWLALVAEELLKAVLFFHPAVHWLVGRVRLAREQTVDAEVVLLLGGREAYLESLVEVARFAARSRAVPAAPFLRESHLRERVDLLLKEVPMSRLRTFAHVTVTAIALVLAVSWAASAVPLQSAKPAAPAAKVAISDEVKAPAPPKLVHQVRPAYPEEAKKAGVQGLVMIDLTIGKDGAVKDARVVASAPTAERLKELDAKKGTPAAIEGDASLASAALDSVKQWRYEPIVKDGKPVDFKATVTVAFKLG